MAANVLDSIDALFQRTEENDPPVENEQGLVTEPKTHANELEDLERFIEDEMERRKTSFGMTWRKLDKCFKWQALKDHLVFLGFTYSEKSDLYKQVEALLKSNDLATSASVEYDKEEKKITRINHPDLVKIYDK